MTVFRNPAIFTMQFTFNLMFLRRAMVIAFRLEPVRLTYRTKRHCERHYIRALRMEGFYKFCHHHTPTFKSVFIAVSIYAISS